MPTVTLPANLIPLADWLAARDPSDSTPPPHDRIVEWAGKQYILPKGE